MTNDRIAVEDRMVGEDRRDADNAGARIGGLACARGAMQVLSLSWFVFSARAMNDHQFGLMAAALAVVVLVGALGDLGMTRTVVLAIAGHPERLWSTFRSALLLRLSSGGALAFVGFAATSFLDLGLTPPLFLAAAATALLSGISEIAMSALRSIGRTGFEAALVVSERIVFLVVAVPLVLNGGGALTVMVTYALTNGLSAALGIRQVAAVGRTHPETGIVAEHLTPRLLDRGGWLTALSGSLVTLGFRLGTLVLVVLSDPESVGLFSIAQRAPEAVALLGITAGGPVLALARQHIVRGEPQLATAMTLTVVMALLTATTPLFTWFVVQPRTFLDLFFGVGSRPGASQVLTLLAFTGVLWVARLAGETILLAEGRSGRFSSGLLIGLAVNVAVAAVLVPDHGATGAATASLLSEIVIAALVLGPLVASNARRLARQGTDLALLGTGTSLALFTFGGRSGVLDLTLVGVCSLGAALAGWRLLATLDPKSG